MTAENEKDISLIIPVFNEARTLTVLIDKALGVLKSLGRSFEIIVVNDGSTDTSADILATLKVETPELRVITFGRNFGQSAALTAGFDYSRGRIIITMDGDLQNDPEDIPHLLAPLEDGADLVCGWRRDRKDPLLSKRLPSFIANGLIRRLTGINLHDHGCTLKAFRQEVVSGLRLYGELHRLIPVLIGMEWERMMEVPVRHHERIEGKSKYGIGRTYRVIIDLLLLLFFQKFATRPLQLFGIGGSLLFGAGFAVAAYLSYIRLVLSCPIADRPLLLLGVLLMITGIVFFGIGLLAELVIRTYYESSGKRIYSIREIIE